MKFNYKKKNKNFLIEFIQDTSSSEVKKLSVISYYLHLSSKIQYTFFISASKFP